MRQLRCFVATAEAGHFSQAAKRLGVTTPSVTAQVQRLERELGVTLFERTTRRVRLTAVGEVLVAPAGEVLEAVDRAGAAVADHRHREERRVRLGVGADLGDRLVAVSEAFSKLEPDGELRITTADRRDRVKAVTARGLDAALLRGTELGGRLERVEVWSDPLLAAVATGGPLDVPGPLALADLAGMPLRLPDTSRGRGLRSILLTSCAAAGFSPTRAREVGDDEAILAVIARGSAPGWAVVDAEEAVRWCRPGLTFRPLQDPEPVVPTFVAVRRGERTPGIEALIAACREVGALNRRRSTPRRGAGSDRRS